MKKRLLLIAGTPAPTTREQLEVVQSAFSPGVIECGPEPAGAGG